MAQLAFEFNGVDLTGTSGTTITLPSVTATLVGEATTNTLTNKTINGANNTLTVRLANDVSGTLPVANGGTGITSFGTGIATFLGTPSSANLASAITDETGSGSLVFATSPTLVTPNIGVATGTSFNSITGLSSTTPVAGGTAAVGTGTTAARADHVHPVSALTISTGLSGTSYNGSSAVTIAIDSTVATLSGSQTLTNKTLGSGTTLGAALAAGTNKITGLGDPTAAQDAATKAYVDSVAQGLDIKASVRAATTAAGTLATSFANGQIIDGVTLVTGDRILIKNQFGASAFENGIYTVNASGAPTRATDMDAAAEFPGAFTFVEEGTTLADTGWVCTNNTPVTIGTTAITFTQFSGAGTYTASGGISLSGNDFRIANAAVGTWATTPSSANLAAAVTDETGSGALVFATSPTLVTPNIGVATGTSFNSITALSSTTPSANGTAAVGTSTTVARADHVHPISALTIGTGLSGTSYNGSSAVTVAIDSTVATLTGTQTFTNKTLTDSTTFFQDETDNTKKMQLQLSGISTATTRTLTVPNVDGTIVTTGDTGTVTNGMLAGSIANNKLSNSTISGVALGSNLNALTIGTGLSGTSYNGSGAVTIAIDSTVATLTGSQTLSNKTLSSAILTGTLTAGGGVGTNGQVLTSTGTGVQWSTASGGTGFADETMVIMGAY